VLKNHHDAMNAKAEVVASAGWNVRFTRLPAGLEKYSTLRQQLVVSDSVVSLVLVFRDEVFRCVASGLSQVAAAHNVRRRPFTLNTRLHSELCRCICLLTNRLASLRLEHAPAAQVQTVG
jgi:hypothetical protein